MRIYVYADYQNVRVASAGPFEDRHMAEAVAVEYAKRGWTVRIGGE